MCLHDVFGGGTLAWKPPESWENIVKHGKMLLAFSASVSTPVASLGLRRHLGKSSCNSFSMASSVAPCPNSKSFEAVLGGAWTNKRRKRSIESSWRTNASIVYKIIKGYQRILKDVCTQIMVHCNRKYRVQMISTDCLSRSRREGSSFPAALAANPWKSKHQRRPMLRA